MTGPLWFRSRSSGYATARECIKGPVWVASGVRPGTHNAQNAELAGLTRLIKYANRRLKLVTRIRTSLEIHGMRARGVARARVRIRE